MWWHHHFSKCREDLVLLSERSVLSSFGFRTVSVQTPWEDGLSSSNCQGLSFPNQRAGRVVSFRKRSGLQRCQMSVIRWGLSGAAEENAVQSVWLWNNEFISGLKKQKQWQTVWLKPWKLKTSIQHPWNSLKPLSSYKYLSLHFPESFVLQRWNWQLQTKTPKQDVRVVECTVSYTTFPPTLLRLLVETNLRHDVSPSDQKRASETAERLKQTLRLTRRHVHQLLNRSLKHFGCLNRSSESLQLSSVCWFWKHFFSKYCRFGSTRYANRPSRSPWYGYSLVRVLMKYEFTATSEFVLLGSNMKTCSWRNDVQNVVRGGLMLFSPQNETELSF